MAPTHSPFVLRPDGGRDFTKNDAERIHIRLGKAQIQIVFGKPF
jgi:hypothetical protein